MKQRILVVDDEPDVVDLVKFNLTQAGFDVATAENGAGALQQVQHFMPHLIVLDVMIPELNGLEVCKLLRRDQRTASIPIIMLTAKAAEIDRVLGLELGADDYVTKPFSPRELILRIRKRLEAAPKSSTQPDQYKAGDLVVDIPKHIVTIKGKKVDLTATEFRLLVTLVQRRGHVQSRDVLLRGVWEYDKLIDTRTVDTHMRRLREKLGPFGIKHLDTVRGVGYRFVEK
ncbi:MAG: response regulator [Limisphaerales bacterium]